jgi:hypothetical protein
MNQTNRGVTVSRCGAPSGEPVLAEVGAPFMLSLDIAGYCSVVRTLRGAEPKPRHRVTGSGRRSFGALPLTSTRELRSDPVSTHE